MAIPPIFRYNEGKDHTMELLHRRHHKIYAPVSITHGSIAKAILYFYFPILFGSFFQQLYNATDAIIVGKFVGTEALAAVGGGTSTFVNLLVGFFVGLSNGATVVISQQFGARDKNAIHRSIETAMSMALISAALVTVVGYAVSGAAMRAIGTPKEIMDLSVSYLHIFFLGSVSQLVYNMGSCILRSMGDSKTPLYCLIVGTLSNIVLDILFIAVFRWGVKGAAYATIVCQTITAVMVLVLLTKNPEPAFQFHFRQLMVDRKLFGTMLLLGIPAGLQGSMYNISNTLIQGSINSLGTTTIAGNAAYGKFEGLYWMSINSFGVAVSIFAGQNYGAGQYRRVKQGTWATLAMSIVPSVFFGLLFLGEGTHLMELFTSDPAVVAAGMRICRVVAPTYLTYISIEILSGTIRGCGNAVIPTVFTALGVCVYRVLWVLFYFPRHPSIETIMACYPISWILTSIIFWVFWAFSPWKRRTLDRPDQPVR